MLYREFVKMNFHKLPHTLSAKEKMKELGKMWKQSGHAKKMQGKGLGSTLGSVVDSVFGLGMEKKQRGRPKKHHKRVAEGAGLGSSIGSVVDSVFGLGMEKPKKARGRPKRSSEKGKGLLGNIIGSVNPMAGAAANMFGLGMKKKGKKHRMDHSAQAHEHMKQLLAHAYMAGHSDKTRGGDLLGSFLSGIATPFRVASAINPEFGFGIDKAADALGVPKIQDLING